MTKKNAREWVQLYVEDVIHKYDPNFCVKRKDTSILFKILRPVLKLINPRFFDRYITTFGGTMWVPDYFLDDSDDDYEILGRLATVAHEGVHVYDEKRLPFLYYIMYLFPQCLAIPSLILAFFCSWWWLFGLLFLLPLPAPGRYYIELRAYRSGHIWNKYFYNTSENEEFYYNNWVGYQLSSPQTYYATWPVKACVVKDMGKEFDMTQEPYKDIIEFLKKHQLIS